MTVGPAMGASEVDEIVRRLRDEIGLRPGALSQVRLRLAASAIADAAGIVPEQLASLLRDDSGSRQALVDHVTVQESQFFRDDAFFAALRDEILPTLPDPLTVWSAGCAHGQEAFSVAMLLREAGRSQFRILATDVSAQALGVAGDAVFAGRQLRGLSPERRARFLAEPGGDRFQVATELRDAVRFEAHNLATMPPPPVALDARLVLLRNVLIYFEERFTRALLRRLATALPADAWILLGGSEVLHRVPGLRIVRVGGVYGYRVDRPGAATASVAAPAVARAPTALPGPAATPVAPVAAAPAVTVDEAPGAAGERHAAAGDHAQAVRCFRRAVYLDGEDVAARLGLALSLEACDDLDAAARAFRAARSALARRSEEPVGEHAVEDLLALVAERLGTLERA